MPTFFPRFPPPHIVCRPFLASSSLPAHHARRPQLRPLAPYAPNAGPQAVCRRTSVTQPAIGPAFRALGRSPHAEFTSALHLSAPLRGARLRSHHLPPRRSRVALLRSFFPPAASGSRTMNSASSVHRPSASIRVRSSVSPNHNTATSPPRCSLRKVCGSITPALWRRAFRSYVTPRDPPGLRSRSSHLARCAIPGCLPRTVHRSGAGSHIPDESGLSASPPCGVRSAHLDAPAGLPRRSLARRRVAPVVRAPLVHGIDVLGNATSAPPPGTCCRAARERAGMSGQLRRPATGPTSHNGAIMRSFGRKLPHTLGLSSAHPRALQPSASGSRTRHMLRASRHPTGWNRTAFCSLGSSPRRRGS